MAGETFIQRVFATYGKLRNKLDYLWNLDTIPNFDVDGIPDPLDEDALRLSGFYYAQERSHFRAGRIYELGAFPTSDAQYSSVFGWACAAVDVNEANDGHGSKGSFAAGYQCISSGFFANAQGFNNVTANGGLTLGWENRSGGVEYQVIGQNYVNNETLCYVRISGNQTSLFPDNLIIALKMYKTGADRTLLLNRVLSTSYTAGGDYTTINLKAPLSFQYADDTTLDIHGFLNKSYVIRLAQSGTGNFLIGINNRVSSNYATAIGVGNKVFNDYGLSLGKDAYSKNRGEIAMGSGLIIDGNETRYSQKSQWHLKALTTNISPVEMTLDSKILSNYNNNIVLQNNTALNASIRISAYMATGGEAYAKTWHDVIIRHKPDGTMTILHESTPLVVTETNTASFTAVLSVAVDGKIKINVTGHAANKVNWTAWIEGVITGVDVPYRTI